MTTSEYQKVCEYAARIGGQVLRDMLGKVGVREKGHADLVTDADFAAQRAVREIVLGAYPDHLFLGEESDANEVAAASGASGFRWIVDPLDGTTNFVHGVPLFASSVALASGKEVLCGTVYNPMLEECFTAAQGEGAFLNGIPIRTSGVTGFSEALVSVSFPTTTCTDSPDLLAFLKFVPESQAIRRTGSTAINLAYIAAGRFDLMTCYGSNAWDVAAGVVLVQEAGGVISDPSGAAFDLDKGATLASATKTLHDKAVWLINGQ
ncbi:MAG: inositol monophosphatase [Planctomycetaceae bacterium]|nr:inositol monophosphatase [Planctomycetaceae bacterium]